MIFANIAFLAYEQTYTLRKKRLLLGPRAPTKLGSNLSWTVLLSSFQIHLSLELYFLFICFASIFVKHFSVQKYNNCMMNIKCFHLLGRIEFSKVVILVKQVERLHNVLFDRLFSELKKFK